MSNEKQLSSDNQDNTDHFYINKEDSLILLVDDIPQNLQVLGKVLKSEGYKFAIATDGKETFEVLEDELPDLILLDIMLPDIDGFEICRRLKANPKTADIPIIFLTAKIEIEDKILGFKLGAVDYITKPFEGEEVIARVNTHLQLKKSKEKITVLYQSLLEDLKTASAIQSFILPNWISIDKNIIFSSTYKASTQIGGDLFDIIPINNNSYWIYIADVSGHGVQAALIMTAVRSTINMILENEKDDIEPYIIAKRLNSILSKKVLVNNYMTFLLCHINFQTNTLKFFNAGHPPLATYNMKTGKVEKIQSKGSIPVGWFADYEYTEKEQDEIVFDDETIFTMYTDGIFESFNADGEELGIENFLKLLAENANNESNIILPNKIKKHLLDLNYDISGDDFTLISFRKNLVKRRKNKLFLITSIMEKTGEIANLCEKFVIELTNNNEVASKVELIVNEFINNILLHGLEGKNDTNVVFEIEIKDEIILSFWDKGHKWEYPYNLESDAFFNTYDPYNTSGRGIAIINSIASKIVRTRYDEINETIITLSIENTMDL